MDSRAVASSFLTSWSVQDVELTCMHMHENIVYKIHVARDIRPFGGERHGIAECREAMFAILADFDYIEYVPTIASAMGNVVRAHIQFKCRHRNTGTILEGTRRLVMRVRNELIERVDSYHDAQLMDVFMRLTRQREAYARANNTLLLPPRLREGFGTGSGSGSETD